MRRPVFVLALVFLGLILACGDDGPTTPSGPQRAAFTLSVTDRDWWPNDNPEKAYWLTAIVRMRSATR